MKTSFPSIHQYQDVINIESKPLSSYLKETATYQVIKQAAESTPNNTAFIELRSGIADDSAFAISYVDFLYKINGYINHLAKFSLKKSDVIMVGMGNTIESIALTIAAQTIAVAFPINMMMPLEVIEKLIVDSCPKLFISDKASYTNINGTVYHLLNWFSNTRFITHCEIQGRDQALMIEPDLDINRICALAHTSGTTSLPKIAKLSQQNILYSAWVSCCALNVTQADNFYLGLPLFHPSAISTAILPMCWTGATTTLASNEGWMNENALKYFWQNVEKLKITLSAALPMIYSQLLNFVDEQVNIKSLRHLIAGMPVTEKLCQEFEAKTNLTNKIINIYGLTEATSLVCCPFRLPYQTLSIKPLSLSVINVGNHQVGELIIEGPNVCAGYLNQNSGLASSEKSPSPFHTGDIAHLTEQGAVIIDRACYLITLDNQQALCPQQLEHQLLQEENLESIAITACQTDTSLLCHIVINLSQSQDKMKQTILQKINALIAPKKITIENIKVQTNLPFTAMGKVDKSKFNADGTIST